MCRTVVIDGKNVSIELVENWDHENAQAIKLSGGMYAVMYMENKNKNSDSCNALELDLELTGFYGADDENPHP